MLESVKNYCQQLQKNIVDALKEIDPNAQWQQDVWKRPLGGGGCSMAVSKGEVFEKGGVNFSHVMGEDLPASASAARPELKGRSFEAVGVSLVLHTCNPYVPAAHANVRFFIATKPNSEPVWWFGGGFDLTPYYGFTEDCIAWHQAAKQACDPFGEALYPRFKQWCDDYFYLKHREESRGVGGLFFDDFNELPFEEAFAFQQSVGDHFLKAYAPIINKRRTHAFGEQEKTFQNYRRARYVEFNLVYDRGTLFGLQSGGRTESILVSMPPEAYWGYGWQPEAGTVEAQFRENFLKPKDWLALSE